MFYIQIQEVEEHEHSYSTTVVEPTCTEGGHTVYTCSCGDSYIDDETAALGHDFENSEIFPHEDGKRHCWDCSRCEARKLEACTFTGVVTKEPTETEEGIKTYTCGKCSNSYTESIPKLEDEEEELASGTCGETMNWKLMESGVLTVSGTGEMKDYDGSRNLAPWSAYTDLISEIVVADGVTDLGDFAFYGLDLATKITLPDTLKTIGDGAFCCTGLEEIFIPAGVENLNSGMFESCFDLKKITVHSSNSAYSSDSQGILYNKDKTLLIYCPQGYEGTCVIPSNVQSIGYNAFHYCDKLTAVTIPASVKEIGYFSFAGCYSLESVTLSEGLEKIGKEAFYDCTVLTEIEIPASVKTIEEEAFSCCGLQNIHFVGDAPEIASYAFTLVEATAYYPEGNETWNEDTMIDYGGTLSWVPVNNSFNRIYGEGRVETSFEVADALKEALGISKFSSIIIANGDEFADALAGSYLATQKNAPILLFRAKYVDQIRAYIEQNLASSGTVYILGGTVAVSQTMENALSGFKVKRLAGDTRFDTNIKILEEANVTGEEILVATGWNFADCLSASATGLPVLMVNNTTGKLTSRQIAFLEAHRDNTYTIIGGTGAVSANMQTVIEDILSWEVCRVSGETREETSVKVAETYFDAPEFVLLAYSRNFPDGLCGGPLAHALNAPLLLINERKEAAAAAYVKENGITNGAVLGGSVVVTDASVKVVFGLN